MVRFIFMIFIFSWGLAASSFAEESHDKFFNNILAICGHSYIGKVVESNESDETWRKSKIVIHAPKCTTKKINEMRIPLHVGENKSRTWIISKTETGLRLKHDHRHEDGSPDDVTMYGGDTATSGTAKTQSFPVDKYSKALFIEQGLNVSTGNTWTLSIEPNETLTYRLSRTGRLFQVSFDLQNPVE